MTLSYATARATKRYYLHIWVPLGDTPTVQSSRTAPYVRTRRAMTHLTQLHRPFGTDRIPVQYMTDPYPSRTKIRPEPVCLKHENLCFQSTRARQLDKIDHAHKAELQTIPDYASQRICVISRSDADDGQSRVRVTSPLHHAISRTYRRTHRSNTAKPRRNIPHPLTFHDNSGTTRTKRRT